MLWDKDMLSDQNCAVMATYFKNEVIVQDKVLPRE